MRLALGIMPVHACSDSRDRAHWPGRAAEAGETLRQFTQGICFGQAVVRPVVASKDDGESDGSMSEGEIRLAAAAMRRASRNTRIKCR
jgi:hypothetical protein